MNEALQAILRTNIVIGHVFTYVYRFGLGSQKKKKHEPKRVLHKNGLLSIYFPFLKTWLCQIIADVRYISQHHKI